MLEPIYEADPEGRPVVHHRTVDTGKVDGGRGVSTHFSHERPFAALPEKRLLLGALHKAWTELTECWS